MHRLFRPRSFVSLLLTGFVVVVLPLLIALGSTIHILDGLVQQSAVAVYRSVGRIDNTRKMIRMLQTQERAARLFSVLGERDHLKDVNIAHQELEELRRQMLTSNGDNELGTLIKQLQAREQHLVAVLNRKTGDPESRRKVRNDALEGYETINSLAVQLETLSNTLMVEEIDLLKDRVRINKQTLIWQVTALICFSGLLVVLFVVVIVKPVTQVDRSIERLGEGDFDTPIAVSGPRDLEAIGNKLDWLRKRLNTLDKEKIRMLAHISHELKTPLSSIKEGSGLLKDGLVGPLSRQQAEVVTILDSNCDKLQKLIQDILDFNMARAKEVPPDLENVRLDQLLTEVAGDHHNSMLARNITLSKELIPALVNVNRNQLKIVFDNLLANAVKFTPDNGEITILMKKKGNRVNVLVEDSGPGVCEEDRPQIFLPFYQGNRRDRSVIKGSGLGLAISKEYIQNCSGTLRLLPSSRGARFSVTLPAAGGVQA